MVCVIGIISNAECARAVQILNGAACHAIVRVRGRIEMACERVCNECTIWSGSTGDEIDGTDHAPEFCAVRTCGRVVIGCEVCVGGDRRCDESRLDVESRHECVDHGSVRRHTSVKKFRACLGPALFCFVWVCGQVRPKKPKMVSKFKQTTSRSKRQMPEAWVNNWSRHGKSGSLRCSHRISAWACSATSRNLATLRLCADGLPDAVVRDAQGGVQGTRRVRWSFQLNGAYKHLS